MAAVAAHSHTFPLPTASTADIDAGISSTLIVTPAALKPLLAVARLPIEAIAFDADFTLSPNTNAAVVRHTGTLTADRTVALSTIGAVSGTQFRIVRTGAGAFNLNVGIGPLKALPTDSYADVMFDGSAYQLVGYGTL